MIKKNLMNPMYNKCPKKNLPSPIQKNPLMITKHSTQIPNPSKNLP